MSLDFCGLGTTGDLECHYCPSTSCQWALALVLSALSCMFSFLVPKFPKNYTHQHVLGSILYLDSFDIISFRSTSVKFSELSRQLPCSHSDDSGCCFWISTASFAADSGGQVGKPVTQSRMMWSSGPDCKGLELAIVPAPTFSLHGTGPLSSWILVSAFWRTKLRLEIYA